MEGVLLGEAHNFLDIVGDEVSRVTPIDENHSKCFSAWMSISSFVIIILYRRAWEYIIDVLVDKWW